MLVTEVVGFNYLFIFAHEEVILYTNKKIFNFQWKYNF